MGIGVPKVMTFKDVQQQVKEKLQIYPANASDFARRQNKLEFESCMRSSLYQRVAGCLFGCLIGDALGAYCEFEPTPLTDDHLDQTMKMKGGGVFNLYQGQFTDDSEMAVHLLKALLTLKNTDNLSSQVDKILLKTAEQYVKWGNSAPFDMGITCRKGIEVLGKFDSNVEIGGVSPHDKLEMMLQQVRAVNSGSQSNGSLMRIAPMAIFFAIIQEDPQKYAEFIKNEVSLIHSNEVLMEAGYIWVKVLYDLMVRKNDSAETYQSIFRAAEKSTQNEEMKSWFEQAKSVNVMAASQNMGWAKIAWTYGMNILYRRSENYYFEFSYFDEIKEVIRRGGDSDTNAAIVGGLLGAIVGFKYLPSHYLSTIFKLQFPQPPSLLIDRPKHYEPFSVLIDLLNLIRVGESYKRNQNPSKEAHTFPPNL